MTDTDVVHLALQTILVATKLAAPVLLTSLAIGLGISMLQSVTQIQDVTLTFVPKLAGVAIVLLISGHWMLQEMVGFTRMLFDQLPGFIGSA
jgi:flagellar biosynthetic protein FliQ